MGDVILGVKGLRKSFGRVVALDGLSFELMRGEIFALIGPNGAGKSTTLRILATVLQPDDGAFFLDNVSGTARPELIRKNISYLAEESMPYKNMRGMEYLRFMAALYAENEGEADKYTKLAINMSNLKERLDDKIKTYSKGMMRKLMIASSVMMEPQLAIMDEPTSGLDIENAFYVRKQLKSLKEKGITILLSSHNMLEIEYLADRVGIINKGRLLTMGTPQELKKRFKADNLEQVFMEVAE
ncbi:ABC transporter ATP-binding protein [Spirochaetia bacterium 38H-sp]|uniref:ABC transporter ATP-binding protein n=1 Tax=Rarispira pelagica TaxID=3141764 RepID=A0ABU9UD64_9SPIR